MYVWFLYCFVNKYNDFFEYIIVHREKLLLRTVSSLRYISWSVLEIESGMKKEKMSREEEEGRLNKKNFLTMNNEYNG